MAADDTSAPRVLLVDDDPVLLGVLSDVLLRHHPGMQVERCGSPRAALSRIRLIDYDVVVSDVRMPGIDGIELIAHARDSRPDSLFIVITGADAEEATLRALRAGAYDFIQKPVDAVYFIAAVERAVETRGLRREVEAQQAALKHHAEELERIVEERTRDLRLANRLKDEFLATVSHELRTPLTPILGWARLLRTAKLDDAQRTTAVDSIERNARAQSQLVDDLLDVSRIITGKLRLDVQVVDIVSVLDAALDVILPAARAKGILIEPVIGSKTRVGPIAADPDRLQQVLWNLLSNAVKFTPEGGRIELGLTLTPTMVAIRVTDSGSGISPSFLPFVFDRFRQGSLSSSSRGGLGLGLAIVRHLVELHGGTVAAESDGEGTGATFTVLLPLASAKTSADSTNPPRRFTTRSRPDIEPPSQCLRGKHALVVEDETDARLVLRVALEQAGTRVTAVESAAEALAVLGRETVDVMLCDIGLGSSSDDGYSLIANVRALPPERGGNVPAVALTAFAKPEDRARALEAGFQLHLPKPGPPDLASTLAELIARNGADPGQ